MIKKTILFVEDDVGLSKIIVDSLGKCFNVIPALNGQEALELLDGDKVDCILLDLEMPCMNGIQFLKTIREKGNYTPVIITTGKSCQEYAEQAASQGVHGYMIKPYTLSEIIEKITNVTSLPGRAEDKGDVMQKELHPKVKEVLEYINDNYHKDLSITVLSEKMAISYSHLANLFKHEIEMSFTCYLNRLRVGKAKKLIRNTELTLFEIMNKVGFKTEQHFFKQFKRFAGVTPRRIKNISSSQS